MPWEPRRCPGTLQAPKAHQQQPVQALQQRPRLRPRQAVQWPSPCSQHMKAEWWTRMAQKLSCTALAGEQGKLVSCSSAMTCRLWKVVYSFCPGIFGEEQC